MNILAIDVGATKVKFGMYNKELLHVYVEVTPKNKKAFLRLLSDICKAHQGIIQAIAICLPGIVDPKKGKIIHLPNMSFMDGTDIQKLLMKYTKQVRIDNDAKSYLRAEAKFGAAKGMKNATLLAIGTGIGGASLIDGKIYYAEGSAGEFGHMLLENGKTFEELASGRTATKHRPQDFKRIAKYLGIAMANIVNGINPEAIVITGGFGHDLAKHFLPEAENEMKKHIVSPLAKNTKVIVGKLGPEAAIIGVALLYEKK